MVIKRRGWKGGERVRIEEGIVDLALCSNSSSNPQLCPQKAAGVLLAVSGVDCSLILMSLV